MIHSIVFKIKNKDNRFYAFLNNIIKGLIKFNAPCIKPIHKLLWWERNLRIGSWSWILKTFYYTPMFKSICFKAGKNLNLVSGIPYVNENLKIIIGDNVTIYGNAGFQGYKIFENPCLEIGNNTFIGPEVRIGVGKKIKIGNHCLIAARVYISDHDGHPLDWEKRRRKEPVNKDEIGPITIEDDVWIGEGVFICKGVRVGRGAVIGARSVVTRDVPEFTIVVGNPARVPEKVFHGQE